MSQTSFNLHDKSCGTKSFSPPIPPTIDDLDIFDSSSSEWPQQLSWPHQQPAYAVIDQEFSPQPEYPWYDMPSHRRALSNGSIASYDSLSPYSAGSTLQLPSAISTFRSQHLAPPQDSLGSPTSFSQHLPSPSHTPTQDAMSRSNPRRTASSMKTDASNTAQQAFRTGTHGTPSRLGGSSHSQYSQDLPVTPKTANRDENDAYSNGAAFATRHVPKFDRTMSDIYQDELFDPAYIPSAPSNPPASTYHHSNLLFPHTMVNQRLHQANQARNSPSQPLRQASPFRSDSTWVNAENMFGPNQPTMQTAAGIRERQKAETDELVYRQHHPQQEDTEPNTVSPKDAFPLDPDVGEDDLPALFPQSSQSGSGEMSSYAPHNTGFQGNFDFSMPSTFDFATPSIPASTPAPDANYSVSQFRPESSNSVGDQVPDYSAHMASMETIKSEDEDEYYESSDDEADEVSRPTGTTAGSGTYTCTYHGCSHRFESPSKLQQHKREGHRSTGQTLLQDHGESSLNSMTQAGPHRCMRTNPSTGKPCNTVFSRPYDLTRHEDTIHAERKKVRCQYCTEEKLFSRADALTRHLRVVHPQVSFPTKHRRRAM